MVSTETSAETWSPLRLESLLNLQDGMLCMLIWLWLRFAISGNRPVSITLAWDHGVENDCDFWNPNCFIWFCVLTVVSLKLHPGK
jgi:hypothetical protein